MKLFKSTILLIAALMVAASSFAQNATAVKPSTKTESFVVGGKCEMCKTRIEKTVKVEGVTRAAWDLKTKKLTVVYNPAKIKIDDLQKKLAAVGHDTPHFKATAKVYNALPSCCLYR